MSKITDLLAELIYPVREPAVLLAMVVFYVLISFAVHAGGLGLYLLLLVVPAYFRYLTLVTHYRAQGREAEPPTAELFQLSDISWSMFPIVVVALFGFIGYRFGSQGNAGMMAVVVFVFIALYPAILGVLAITHSPVEAMKPHVLGRLIRHCGAYYWLVPGAILVLGFVSDGIRAIGLPGFVSEFFGFYTVFAIHALLGGVLRINRLIEDVSIPDPVDVDEDTRVLQTQQMRNQVLSHAYGLISRGNRDAGMEHIYQALDIDAEPDDAWRYYQDQMLRWENSYPALLFAQQHLHRLLAFEDQAGALKLITRARFANAEFKPLRADVPKALSFAEQAGNQELVNYLRALR